MRDPIIYQSEFIRVRQGDHNPYVEMRMEAVSFEELYNEMQDAKNSIKSSRSKRIYGEIQETVQQLVKFDNGLQAVDVFADNLSEIVSIDCIHQELNEISDSSLKEIKSLIANFTLSNWTPVDGMGAYYRYDDYSECILTMPMSNANGVINFIDMGLISEQAFNDDKELHYFLEQLSTYLGKTLTPKMIGG
jgi:hypothetical protein